MAKKMWLLHGREDLGLSAAEVGCPKSGHLTLRLVCMLRMKSSCTWGSKRIRYHAVAGVSTGSLIKGLSMLWDAGKGGHVHGVGRV